MHEVEKQRPWSLSVLLRREESGPELALEPVAEADLAELRAEAWFRGILRKGYREMPLHAVPMRVVPRLTTKGRCSGFGIETTDPEGRAVVHPFTLRSLKEVAIRAADRLIKAEVLKPGEVYYYELIARMESGSHHPIRNPGQTLTFTSRDPALRFLSVPLQPLLQRGVAIGKGPEDLFPVFYTGEALAQAERCARRGAKSEPPTETGAVLLGPLCSCPETGEAFVVVCQIVEVTEADEREFSLAYSDRSWNGIRQALAATQAREEMRTYRLLGQAHGHNFHPRDGELKCETCPKQAACSHTSVFVSEADQSWSRAVFSRQPWHLCHIFGLSARGERIHGLYAQLDGRLQARPFHLIPDFHPTEWTLAERSAGSRRGGPTE